METSRKILLVSGLGTLHDHLVAAAIALRRHPSAKLAFSSMMALPDVLTEHASTAYAEVHLLGIGLDCDATRLETALRALHRKGAAITWHSAGYPVPETLPPSVTELFDPHVSPRVGLARWIAEDLGVKADPMLELLDEKPKTEVARRWRTRFSAAGWSFSNAHDWTALESAVRDLAESVAPANWGEPVKILLDNFDHFGYRELQASAPKMRRLRKEIGHIARSGVRRVLITGESGVGKETVAQQIHVQSGRRGPFLAFNCATVARELIESRLFGHTKGAFTDAKEEAKGIFQEANGGTVFLDEIAELPLELQGVLLRVLQEGRVLPVGAPREVPVSVRVVAATNQDLPELVRQRRFREDLYWRLATVEIRVPPLREREGDLTQLAKTIWAKIAPRRKPLSKEELVALRAYDWPGNVRQLDNLLERAVIFEDRTIPDLIEEERKNVARLSAPSAVPEPAGAAADAATAAAPPPQPPAIPSAPPEPAAGEEGASERLDDVVRAHVIRTFERHHRNLAATARALDIARNTLRSHLKPRADGA